MDAFQMVGTLNVKNDYFINFKFNIIFHCLLFGSREQRRSQKQNPRDNSQGVSAIAQEGLYASVYFL